MSALTLKVPGVLRLAAVGLLRGVVRFGVSFAVAQCIRRELVEERRWIDEAAFAEALVAASAPPGTRQRTCSP